jgi:hypothetical protein
MERAVLVHEGHSFFLVQILDTARASFSPFSNSETLSV